jgi:DMSO reductase family type II enzyme heme b subunit
MRVADKIKSIVVVVIAVLALCATSFGAGDASKGEAIYKKRCAWCHGPEGLGDGPAQEFLLPGPRDLSDATFKYRTSSFDELLPTDDDLFKIIKGNAARSSAMPGFFDVLSDAEIWDTVAYVKTLAGIEGMDAPGKIFLTGRVESSAESIREGKRLFEEKGRCTDCHGLFGRGDAIKTLKDDWGKRTWPRNLTKGWTFMVSNEPADVYSRISAGIPGTQMPSFADPKSKLALSDAERWHVANYAASLDVPYKLPAESTTVNALSVVGALPEAVDDRLWEKAAFTSFRVMPQLMANERLFTPTIDSVSIKALYNKTDVAILIEWDDRTESVPGDEAAQKLANGELFPDAVALEFPIEGNGVTAKPHFAEGGPGAPVDIWLWKGRESLSGSAIVASYTAKGFKERPPRSNAGGLTATGKYTNGTWRVMMRRSLTTSTPDDAEFVQNSAVPIAIAIWDGSNGEHGSRHTLTTWRNISFLAGDETGRNRWLWPIAIAVCVFVAEIVFIRSVKDA